ncbi:protein FAM13A [Parasteatoda tepidariorum]|uniref:protein FAM13A n=1 Tax=Parasteatoda tepidariorum TaxID=114398 RepID=UPI001C71C173|nr:protein FAM13B [Parasteatoda tepidariorum]
MLASNQHQESSGESRIDKMRKFLSSPLTRKKTPTSQCKTFGTPLEILLQRCPSEYSVPFIITRLCQYIQASGFTHEGLFRISGNARSVERLKISFDRSGDAPLETEGDVPTAAALLKLFLRELPDPIIPLNLHCQFLNAVKDKSKEESVMCLGELVKKLPPVNYNILSYLFSFLKKVSDFEEQNRMSPSSLGIVFGPNLFRVTEDFVGLKEQSLTNQIVTYFITDYQDIFKQQSDIFNNHSHISLNISKANQVSSMVSSWPEAKGSSAMLSTWSLGHVPTQNELSEDSYLSLGSLTHSLAEMGSDDFYSVEYESNCGAHQSKSYEFQMKDLFLGNPQCTSDLKHENATSKQENLDRKNSLGKESCLKDYYIMEEEPMLSHSSLEDKISLTSASSLSQEKREQLFLTVTKENSSPPQELLSYGEYSHDVHDSGFSEHMQQSKITHEKSEEMLKDIHKGYPRGRRRHVRHHKVRPNHDERRSHSEVRPETNFQNEDEFNGNSSVSHYDKSEVQYNSTGSLAEDSSSGIRHSWPAFRKCKDEEDIALSPCPQRLEITLSEEASISPSAFRSYLSHRNLHLDPNLPPSPPVEQEDLVVTGAALDAQTLNAKQLARKIHGLKKKLKLFEDNFEKLYGYKPSHAEKCANITVKKTMAELNNAKTELKQFKENPFLFCEESTLPNKSSKGTNTRSSQGLFSLASNSTNNISIEDTVRDAQAYLSHLRKENNRPETLEEMDRDQLVSEKIAVQKVLLNFESMHGRPSTKAGRELIRPLYDRYRSIKRLITRYSSSKDNPDLMPILEGETMDFKKCDLSKNINKGKPCSQVPVDVQISESRHEGMEVSSSSSHINFHELSM